MSKNTMYKRIMYKRVIKKKPMFWFVVLVILLVAAVTVYAVMPAISLNSPTSFPVDI